MCSQYRCSHGTFARSRANHCSNEASYTRCEGKYPDLKADIRILNDQNPVKTASDDPFVQLVQNVAQSLKSPTKLGGLTGYTDGSQFVHADKAFPIIVLGPGDTLIAHQPDEYVEVAEFLHSIQLYQ